MISSVLILRQLGGSFKYYPLSEYSCIAHVVMELETGLLSATKTQTLYCCIVIDEAETLSSRRFQLVI